jgi:glycogen debranching enzyme
LILPNLRENQLEAVLDLMDSSFNVPYPLPSVATTSPNYDPHNRELDRLWRGPVWMNTNWYLADRGLKTQLNRSELSHRRDLIERCAEWEQRIIVSSKELLDLSGPYEHYNPLNGEAQRKRVRNFAWSNLGYVMLRNS